jgi:VCBS repeat-containing protein
MWSIGCLVRAHGAVRVLVVTAALLYLPAPALAATTKVMGRVKSPSSDRYRAAYSFLERHARAFGMSPVLGDLTTAGRSDDVGGTVLRFAQLHGEVPVLDAGVIVGFDRRGDIIYVDSGYVPHLDVPTRPRLSKAEAIRIAQHALGAHLSSSPDVRLVVAKGDKAHPDYHLAWEVTAVLHRPRGDWQILVDSQTGAVIRTLDLLQRAGPACVPADPASDSESALVFAKSPVDQLDDPSLRDADNVDAELTGCKLGNLTSSTDLTGRYANTSLTPSPRATPPYTSLRSVNQRAVDEASAYYDVNRSKEYLNALGFPSVMDHSIDLNAADPFTGDNSFYSSVEKSIHLGTGGVDDAQDPDVVYHELMHAIQDDQVPGFGASEEAGALGEGTADYWAGELTDDAATTALGPACVGAWNAVSFNPYTGDPSTGCVRRLDSSKQFPRDLDGEVHDDGEIYSAALWRLRAALGGDVADRLVIKSHTFLQSSARFIDAADALHSADVALYGGAHDAAIDAAMEAGGIPRTASPASSAGLASTSTVSCGSAHPYANQDYAECRSTVPGAKRLRAHFSSFSTEDGFDIVRISDAHYRQVQELSGEPFPSGQGVSAAVKGDTIVVRFKADGSTTADGFQIDRIDYTTNSAPRAVADAYTQYGSDTALAVAAPGVLANDEDDDGDSLTASRISNPSHGSLTFNSDGSFTYQPNEDYVGTDTFTYRANDGTANSSPATVTITVGAGCNGMRATLTGTSAANKLNGTAGDDVIAGLGGADTILGAAGNDTICGGAGNDTINAGSGADYVNGGADNDTLRGDVGNDTLLGGAGADVLQGDAGNDSLTGGAGAPDSCKGDTGTDTADSSCEKISGVP